MLGTSRTRWLALLPAVERILQLFKPLKSYFLSNEKCPKIKNFFSNDQSELWIYFIHNQSSVFHTSIKKIEGEKTTIIDISEEIDDLILKYKERVSSTFIPPTLNSMLTELIETGSVQKIGFEKQITNFYANIISYLELWAKQFDDLKHFKWVNLKKNNSIQRY